MSQVVHDYGDVCQAITELAVELNAPISTDDFRTLNRCLDDAIAGAVTEYGRERNQSGIDGESARGSERLGFFAHEFRNLMNTAIMAFEVLKTGDVGVGGSTGTVLHRTLMASRALISRSLAEVRLTQGIQNREQFLVAQTERLRLQETARRWLLTNRTHFPFLRGVAGVDAELQGLSRVHPMAGLREPSPTRHWCVAAR